MSSHTIMVVDDDPDIRDTLCALLRADGHDVLCHADGLEALNDLRAGARPCLILLDLMMPVLDGVGFRAEQQKDPALASIPVVAITAAGRIVASSIEVSDVLPKPFGFSQVRSVISRYCRALAL